MDKDYEGMDLKTLRAEIDTCDKQITDLLAHRFKLVREMGIYKVKHNLPVLDARRERLVLSKIRARTPGVRAELIKSIFESILDESCQIQRQLKKSFDKRKLDC
jgi:chorismate mutase